MAGQKVVTAQYLLEGTVYSLEQCGLLLRDAIALYKSGSNSSAIVLAAFAREELGRAYILRKLRADVLAGNNVTLETIKDRCGDHVTKQERGQRSIVQRATENQVLAKLMRAKMENHPHSPEYKQADEALERITKRQQKRTPQARHQLRMTSLYVEPNEGGPGWNRPHQKSQSEAYTFLSDAVNDYAGQYDQFQQGSLEYQDAEIFQALQQWTERPVLPEPEWPSCKPVTRRDV